MNAAGLAEIDRGITHCRACPRLVEWREMVGRQPRAAYRAERYWSAGVPGFGSPDPDLLLVGLAPAAHGANRTGRLFTGDRSGDFLFAGLHRAGLAAQPTSTHRGDGQHLDRARLTAVVHCAPPANAPTAAERRTCASWLERELTVLLTDRLRPLIIVALGGIAWQGTVRGLRRVGCTVPRPSPTFGHGRRFLATAGSTRVDVLGCFHPSQQNTFTGRLTPPMLTAILDEAQHLATSDHGPTVRQ